MSNPLAIDLLRKTLARNPKNRIYIDEVFNHFFFWPDSKKLQFLLDASDRLEVEKPDHPLVEKYEEQIPLIIGGDWKKKLDPNFLEDLNRFRKCDVTKGKDLLRVIRNKAHHYRDLPEQLRNQLGNYPSGFVNYFLQLFPELLAYTFNYMKLHCSKDTVFEIYFSPNS